MKTVIQIVQRLAPGGIEVMALEILRLQCLDVNMMIISLEGEKTAMLEQWPRLKEFSEQLIFLDKKPGWRVLTMLKLYKCLLHLQADAIHTHHIGPLIYGGIAARAAGIKQFVHTEHDAWHLESIKRRYLERWACSLLKPTLVADSKDVASSMAKYLSLEAVRIVRNGIDVGAFYPGDMDESRAALVLPKDVKIIGCAGRLEEEKGHKVLLQAMLDLPDTVHLALAGSGTLEHQLRQKAELLGLSDRVHFLGHVNNMVEFYRAIDVFCLPSFKEGMPLAPLEAQACGVPTILTDTGACSETLCPETGCLVPVGAPVELAEAIAEVLQTSTPGASRRFVCENANAKDMVSAYRALCFDEVWGIAS